MKYIGAHVSAAGGVFNAPLNAELIQADAYAMFTKSQRQWTTHPLKKKDIDLFSFNSTKAKMDKSKVLVHDSYLINLASPDKEKNDKSIHAFVEEMRRCRELGLSLLNFHPGSHLNAIPIKDALKKVAENLNIALTKCKRVTPVIETTAGQGTNLGWRFEEIAEIIEQIEKKDRIKVCIDTCHIFAAGYDIRTQEAYTETMNQFDAIIGFDKLAGMHLNDSKKPLGSRVDRHAPLGDGEIGINAFKYIMQDPRMDDIPLILETPEPERWPDEIKLLRNLSFTKN